MTKDISIETRSPVTGDEIFGFPGVDSQYSSGFYKLIMMWLKCLLTEPGTDTARPSYGTGFGALLGANVDSPDLRGLFQISVAAATTQIRGFQTNQALELQEKLADTRLNSVVKTSADAYTVNITITNVAGETLVIALPSNLTRNLV